MKKTLSLLLSLAMTVGMTSSCAAADNDAWKENIGAINLSEMTVKGNGITVSENTVKITAGGDFEVVGTLSDGMIYVNSEEKVKLRLSGASITNTNGPAIYFDNAEKAFITITENTENYLADSKEYDYDDADAALFSNDDLEIKGSGTLNITGNYQHGIAGDDDVTIENGIININSYEHGIKVNDTLSILGGEINVTTETGKGLKAEAEVVIDDGNININSFDEGIESKGTLTINGGNINIISKEDGINTGNASTSESESDSQNLKPQIPDRPQNGIMPEKAEKSEKTEKGEKPEMPKGEKGGASAPPERPQDGNGRNFGIIDEEASSAHAITINGGKINIIASGDGIDSNGSLTINGGEIIIDGPEGRGDGTLDAQGTLALNGGTVIATSSTGMIQFPSSEKQGVLRAVFTENQASGTKVSVKDADGKELMSVSPSKTFQALILSSEDLENNKTYTILLNDKKYQEFTVTDNSASVGSVSGGGNFGGERGRFGNESSRNSDRENINREQQKIKVNVNGQQIQFDTDPTIKNDTTLVGYRAIMEALGADVTWDEETRTVTAVKGDTKIVLTIDSNIADVNGTEYKLLTAPEIINNSTMIPVRFISEHLGMKVGWNPEEKLVTIDKQQ